jgi:hypothetical protein
MASTFVNDLRLEEIGDGEQSTTWGATTNTNLELIAEAFSFGTESITTNADTHTTTIADGSTDPGRSIFLKYTGTLDSECTITIGPNTVSKLWFIENATSGSQNIAISQGSGANVTIGNGQTKVVYSDGAGSGAAVIDALQDLSIPDLFIGKDTGTINFGADADVTLTHVADTGVTLASGTNATTLQVDSNAADENAAPKVILNRTSDSPAANDIGGQIEFHQENDANEQVVIGRVNSQITTITDGSEAGQINLGSMVAGAVVDGMNIAGTTTSLVSAADNANAAPILNLKRTRGSGTAADNDIGGQIDFLMNDAGGNETTIGKIKAKLTTAADGSEAGQVEIGGMAGGAAIVDGDGLNVTGTTTTVSSTTNSAAQGPTLVLDKSRVGAAGANDDLGGVIEFKQENDATEQVIMGRIKSQITDVTDSSEDGKIIFASTNGGTTTDIFTVSGEGTENAVFPVADAQFELGVGGTNKSVHGNDILSALGSNTNRLWKQVNALRLYLGNAGNTEASGSNLFIDGSTNHIILSSSVGVGGGTINFMAFRARGTGTTVGSISSDATQTLFNTTSDYRLKENIVNMSDGITRLKKLAPKRFNFKADSSQTVDGFLAHEVEAVVSNAVVGEKDAVDDNGNIDPQGIDQSKLIPLLTAALQEAIAKIEVLETKVAALEG